MYCPKCGAQIDRVVFRNNAGGVSFCPVCGGELSVGYDAVPPSRQLTTQARLALKNNFGYSVLTQILLGLVQFGSLLLGTIFGPIFVGGAISSSYAGFWLDVASNKCEGTKSTYRGFNNIMPAFVIYILMSLIKLLPVLLLIILLAVSIFIPILFILLAFYGIGLLFFMAWVNSVSDYAFFKLNRDQNVRPTDAIRYGFELVNKNFGKILALKLSFIGWWLLTIVLGFFVLYVVPYYNIALAKQYLAIERLNSQPSVQTED